MVRIYKYPTQGVAKPLPYGRVLLVASQEGSELPYLWIEVETGGPMVRYYVRPTGSEVPEATEHVGSAICGAFVWHVYRDLPE